MPIGAIAGSAVIGAGSNIIAGNKAAKAQKNAADQSSATEKYFYDTTRADQAPYREVGYGALGKLAAMYGVNPASAGSISDPGGTDWESYVRNHPDLLAAYNKNGGTTSIADFGQAHYNTYGKNENRQLPTFQAASNVPGAMGLGYAGDGGFMASPGYQFRRDEGLKAIDRQNSARGILNSGGADKARMRYADGIASSEYDTYANRLAALAGVGQTATQATSAAGGQAANAISQAQTNAGNARASSYANTGANISGGVNNLASLYLTNQGTTPKLPYAKLPGDDGVIWN